MNLMMSECGSHFWGCLKINKGDTKKGICKIQENNLRKNQNQINQDKQNHVKIRQEQDRKLRANPDFKVQRKHSLPELHFIYQVQIVVNEFKAMLHGKSILVCDCSLEAKEPMKATGFN